MTVTLSNRAILTSVLQHLSGVLPTGLKVSWNGMRLDLQSESAWAEVVIPERRRCRSRRGSKDHRQIEIRVRIFQKPGSNIAGHLRLEKKIVPVLEHQEIGVFDYASVGEPKIGQVRTLEVQSSDFTRSLNEQGFTENRAQELNQLLRTNVKAIQLTCKALVQAV